MALPRKVKQLNVFTDGTNWIGEAEDFTFAKLSRKFEAYRGGGMMGAANIHMGLEDGALDTSFTFGGVEAELVKRMGLAKIDGVALRFAGSFQRDDTGEISAVEIVMRGRHKEFDGGENKQGESGTTKMSTECAYYQLTIDGKEIIEIDIINMVLKVDGVDRLAEHRKAIGL